MSLHTLVRVLACDHFCHSRLLLDFKSRPLYFSHDIFFFNFNFFQNDFVSSPNTSSPTVFFTFFSRVSRFSIARLLCQPKCFFDLSMFVCFFYSSVSFPPLLPTFCPISTKVSARFLLCRKLSNN